MILVSRPVYFTKLLPTFGHGFNLRRLLNYIPTLKIDFSLFQLIIESKTPLASQAMVQKSVIYVPLPTPPYAKYVNKEEA